MVYYTEKEDATRALVKMIRVITGSARGRTLDSIRGIDVIRPTSQKIKESMFSAVQFYVPGARVLDLFAGSGQLGIEALSRGASSCVFVDHSAQACTIIRKNLKKTGLDIGAKIVNSDVLVYSSQTSQVFDLILIDPPFRQDLVKRMLPFFDRLLSDGGLALCETESDADLDEIAGSTVLKKKYRHGGVTVWLYCKES